MASEQNFDKASKETLQQTNTGGGMDFQGKPVALNPNLDYMSPYSSDPEAAPPGVSASSGPMDTGSPLPSSPAGGNSPDYSVLQEKGTRNVGMHLLGDAMKSNAAGAAGGAAAGAGAGAAFSW